MKSYANWEEFLMPAPISIAILGQLVFISAAQKDFSINKNPPTGGFKHIRYPESFRACLCQVSNQGWEAFNAAHGNMNRIRLLCMNVPGWEKVIVKILFQDMEMVNAMLPIQLKNRKAMTDDCEDLAQPVEDKYSAVIHLIQELLEACLNAKKGYEDKLKGIEIALQQARIKEKATREAQKLAEQYHNQIKQLVGESLKQYKEAMQDFPTGWDLMGMATVETSAIGHISLITSGKKKGHAGDNLEEDDDGSPISTLNVFAKSGHPLVYTLKLKNLINEHSGLNMKKVVNEETGAINSNWMKKT
uniref:Uncharacterized protein n=1 Tax=Pelodiscus sinensis TaxID=13735 RepID=K7F087_PELSI